MNCFHISNEDKVVPQNKKSSSTRSNSSRSTDDRRRLSELSSPSGSSSRRSPFPSFSERPNNLRVFTYKELRNATKNFSNSLLVGEGGFGCVYKGSIRSSEDRDRRVDVAVKQLNRRGMQGHKEWFAEVDILGVVEHPNLVKLIGYCAEDDGRGIQRLLVYEFMSNRSVADHLSPRSTTPLSWPMRLRVALDTARGLTYLHEGMDFQIIFRDLKTSNILLDEQLNAKLSDFGLARQGPEEGLSHVSTVIVGTLGYAAPEYIHTGHLTAKSDIWSYGVVLYELITGRQPLDKNRPKGEEKLLEWIRSYISDVKKFPMIIDPRIEGNVCVKLAMKLAAVANKCLLRRPKSRPKMSEVLDMVHKLVEETEIGPAQPPLRPCQEGKVSEDRKGKRQGLKRTIGDFIVGEGRWFMWRIWTPKLLRAH